jgi:hypothetical protein
MITCALVAIARSVSNVVAKIDIRFMFKGFGVSNRGAIIDVFDVAPLLLFVLLYKTNNILCGSPVLRSLYFNMAF